MIKVTPETSAVIPPQEMHYVETVGMMTMQVEFYKANPATTDQIAQPQLR